MWTFLSNIARSRRGFRLTTPGKVFFSFLVSIIVIAMVTGNNLLFLIISVMMGFMIVSGIESERNIRDIKVTRLTPGEFFAGTQSNMRYVLRCPSRDVERVVVHDLEPIPLGFLKKGESSILEAKACFEKRGRNTLGKIKVYTTFPYGLFEKSILFDQEDHVIVYPKPIEYQYKHGSSWKDNAGKAARDMESVSHTRPYTPGDPFSAIAWKKQNTSLVTKVWESTSGMSTLIVLVPGKDIETKLGMATFLVLDFHAKGLSFGIVINNYFSGMDNSRMHRRKILERLALVKDISVPIKVRDHAAESFIYV